MISSQSLASPRSQAFAFAGIATVYLATVAYYLTVIGPYIVDDAFIYFRYADNLARGHGLAYNPGDPVEGYTGLSWVLLLGGAAALGLQLIAVAQCLGVVMGAVTLFLTWRISLRLIGARPAALLPALFLATQRSFAVWSIEGLETQLFAALLIASVYAWLTLDDARPPYLGLLTGLMTLTRPEGLLFASLMGAFALRRTSFRCIARNGLVYLSLVGGQLVFRGLYYHDLLPNTYYAKIVGSQLGRGVSYLCALASANHIAWYAPATVLGAVIFARSSELRPVRLWTLASVLVYACYVAAIGGDYFEFRFFVPVLPLWAIWTVAGSLELARLVSRPVAQRSLIALATLAWLGANLANNAHPPEDSLEITSVEAEAQYTQTFVRAARWLALNVRPRDYLAIRPAGAIAYFTRVRCLDLLGLNDRAIARDPKFIALDQSPGHQREVPRDYLVQRNVTYFVGHPQFSPAPARPGRGHISIEVQPGLFLILHRIAVDAPFQDRIYFLGQHAGSLEGWKPVER